MDIIVESVDVCAVKTIVVIAADEYLLTLGQIAEPVEEIQRLALLADHAEVARVNHDVGVRHFPKPMMRSVSI